MHRKMLACIDLACCSSPTVFSGGSAFPPNLREVSARCKQHKNPGKSSMSRCRQDSNPGIFGCRQHRKPRNLSIFRCKQQVLENLSISRCRQHRNPGNLGILGKILENQALLEHTVRVTDVALPNFRQVRNCFGITYCIDSQDKIPQELILTIWALQT